MIISVMQSTVKIPRRGVRIPVTSRKRDEPCPRTRNQTKPR